MKRQTMNQWQRLIPALGLGLLLTGTATAVETPLRPQIGVDIDKLPTLHVTTLGQVIRDDYQGLRGGCDHVETYSGGPFDGGGSIVLQAGFAQEEAAGATYQIHPDNFPIKINKMEMVFGTSGTNVMTTTKWAVHIYDGLPTTGTLAYSFYSDDLILPHIVLPPGTHAVNLAVAVDPNDPEQLIVYNNSGTNIFTIAFQIVEHNNQTQDPCWFPPPSNSNAFPATDVDGLNSAHNNWLYAIDCGPWGAPPGWNRFSQLGLFQPSGDWILRVTWQEVSCQPGVGACCYPNGDCTVSLVDDCQNAGGIYMGDGTTDCPDTHCDVNDCPADLDGDGYIGHTDLALLLAYWGGPNGDITGDGTTGHADLALLLSVYGTYCP